MVLLVLVLLVGTPWHSGLAQAKKPLSVQNIVDLLKGHVLPDRVEELARDNGIDFEMNDRIEAQLREAGATDSLINTLRGLHRVQEKPSAPPAGARSSGPESVEDKESYALGMNIGEGLAKQGAPVNPDMVARGLKDSMAGKVLMTDTEMNDLLQKLRDGMKVTKEAKDRETSAANRQAGDAFLAANKSKPGVYTLPDGLQYKILRQGTGPKPASTDSVTVNYRGNLIDGKEFDSSYKRGKPATFPVNGVIKGWTEALQMMPVGSKWELYIPPDLGYGDRGAGTDIGPSATLTFEVELISIEPKK
jgi:FKBP-type peptidyl-prolyl cis-trans isomerase FklB